MGAVIALFDNMARFSLAVCLVILALAFVVVAGLIVSLAFQHFRK